MTGQRMPSAVQRYKKLISDALARYFPHTTAYLQAEREASAPAKPARSKGKSASAKPKKTADKPKSGGAAKRSKSAGTGIYSAVPMQVDAVQVKNMQEQVARAVEAGLIAPPSAEQWAMILSAQPLTRIFAGAGSGKSTTLILRVMFMLVHLGIKPEQMTIISFTNASCAELRQQLLKVAGHFACNLSEGQVQQMVRTFHSAMALLAKGLLGPCNWFEQLDERGAAEQEPENPLLASRLRPAQQRLLKQAYQQCFSEQPRFAECIRQLLGEPQVVATKAPEGLITLAGEFTAVPLYEAFYAQGAFAESIGLRVEQLRVRALECPDREKQFAEALVLYWRCFKQVLEAQGLTTFNWAFQVLTDKLASTDSVIDAALLAPFNHLLIDEFQDISPQIVQWLQALQRRIVRAGNPVSLMAIGDDWQSIYGWRGSSPELFMDFDRHFPCKGRGKRSSVLTLATNYRSVEPVIRDAEAVLEEVVCKQSKASLASRETEAGDHGVRLIQRFDLNRRLPELLEQIRSQCTYATARKRERTGVLLLSRRNEPLKRIMAELDRKLPVRAMTIHRAKGLQAEVAIILDDCMPPVPHPLRNGLYAQSGFFSNNYDSAMRDESLRLAYVAITRGVSRVFWYCQKAQGATRLLGQRGR